MAADHRKTPLRSETATHHRDHQDNNKLIKKKKKNNLGSFPTSTVVSLEWDDKNNSVVAKTEQIGLSQRHLLPPDFHCPNVLADVLPLPREVFQLDIVKQVLSLEIWQTLLSVNERHYLMQFLPQGVDIHEVVQELLASHSNFHFGNPFLKWSASLCSGNLHPDSIRHQEHRIRASKKIYYSGLVKYHNGMINNLRTWKEKWSISKNSEEIVQKMWRSRKHAGNMSSDVNVYTIYKVDVAGISESGSSAPEENAGSSDNENLVSQHRELQQRNLKQEDRYNDLAAGIKVIERSKKGERLHKQNIQRCDGSKYMSYIKVSRKQHQRVKSSMKHSSNSIQSRSLNRVLGNLHSFHIQPFEVFEEEERKKLHAHWLQLAVKDVPAAFANFRRWQVEKSRLPHYWKQEMEEKPVFLNKAGQGEEREIPRNMSLPLVDKSASSNEVTHAMEFDEREQSDCLLEEHSDDRAYDDKLIIPSGVVKKEKTDSIVEEMMGDKAGRPEPASELDSQFTLASLQNQHIQKIAELEASHKLCSIGANTGNYVIRERDDSQPNAPECSENLKRVGGDAVGPEFVQSISSHVWPSVSIGNSYRHPTSNSNFGSAQLLSHGYREEQHSGLINMEFDNDEVVGSNLWHKQSHNGSFLRSYSLEGGVRGQNESQQPHYFQGPDTLSCHQHDQKHMEFDFEQLQASSSVSVRRSQYFGKLGEQPNMRMPLIDLIRETDLNNVQVDVGNNISRERMFSSEEFRYSNPMQQQLSSVHSIHQNWVANVPSQTLSPLESCLSYGELVRNRLMVDDQTVGGWSNLESSSHVDGISRSNMDGGSLYSGLSECNNNNTELPYVAPFDLVRGPAQQFIDSGFGSSSVYGGGGVSVVPSVTSNNVLPQPHGELLSGQVPAASAPLLVGSTDVRLHSNSALQESMIKPFLGPWNN